MDDLSKLPDNLPQPKDDWVAAHLLGMKLSSITLSATKEESLDFSKINSQYVVLYFFPMMSTGKEMPKGWNDIPGARGCTPQNITINEHMDDLQKYDAIAIGVSSQPIEELQKISFQRGFLQELASDNDLKFQKMLDIPTFDVEDKTMYKRLTLIIEKSEIIKVFYPVFPPDKHIFEILEWLKRNSE